MAHMIEENDNMFSVQETPWHGLGHVLPEAPSIDKALQISCLDWKVRTLSLSAQQPPVNGELVRGKLPVNSHVALQREDTKEIFTLVSNRYQILQNDEAFEVFRPLVNDGRIQLETAGSLQNGKKVWILAKVAGIADAEVKPGDMVKPYVLLSNSHDGSQAVRFGFTPVRVVCNNTLSWATEHEQSKLVRIYHRGNIRANLDDLQKSLDVAAGEFVARIDRFQKMAKTAISKPDLAKYVRQVLGTADETPREKQILETLINGKGGIGIDGIPTFWDAYNAINEWILYSKGQSPDRRLASAWFGDGRVLDVHAFQIADEFMAKAA